MHDVVPPDLMRPFRVEIAERGCQGAWNRETDMGRVYDRSDATMGGCGEGRMAWGGRRSGAYEERTSLESLRPGALGLGSGGSEVASRETIPQERRGATLAPVVRRQSRCLASTGANRAVSSQAGRHRRRRHEPNSERGCLRRPCLKRKVPCKGRTIGDNRH